MLNHFGLKIVGYDVIVANARKLPSLHFDSSSGSLVLSYLGPDDFGMQSFRFAPSEFLYAYNNSRYKHFTPKADYTPFDFLFFDECYPKASGNKFVRFVFQCFIINPSLIKKVISAPNKHRKFKLAPKKSAILSYSNIIVPKNSNKGATKKISLDPSLVELCNYNMNLAISKSARSFSYMFFDSFLSSFCELNNLNPNSLSKRRYNAIFKKFVDAVDNFNK